MLDTSNNAGTNNKENSSNEELIERVKIPWTPFYVVGTPERGYFVTFGKYKITEQKPTKVEAIGDLEKERWNVTVTVAGLVQEMMIEEEVRRLKEELKEHPHDTGKPDGLVKTNEDYEREARETYKQRVDREQREAIIGEANGLRNSLNRIREDELNEELRKEQ